MAISGQELQNRLLDILRAEELDRRCHEIGVVSLANSLGVRTTMRFQDGARARHGQLRLHPPEIVIFRDAASPRTVEILPSDEPRLRSHERFSIAHEIGHWIAFERLNVDPLSATAGRSSEYWKHEQAVNAFVGSLLVPEVVLAEQLRPWPVGIHLPAIAVERLAKSLQVSRIALARRISEYRADFGYLEVQFQKDTSLPRFILLVKEAIASENFKLPGVASKIRNDRLVAKLQQGIRGQTYLPGVSLAPKRIQNLHLSWDHIGGLPGEGTTGDSVWAGRLVMTCWSEEDADVVFTND